MTTSAATTIPMMEQTAVNSMSSPTSLFSLVWIVVHSLRFEIVFGVVLVAWYLARHLAGMRRRPCVISRAPRASFEKKDAPLAHLPRSSARSARTRNPGGAKQPNQELIGSDLATIGNLLRKDVPIHPQRLCDPEWVIPHLTQLCRTNSQRSLEVYREAIKAGLDLRQMNLADCCQLLFALVMSAVRVGKTQDAVQLFKDIQRHGLTVSTSLFSSVAKVCTSKHLFAECIALYDCASEDPSFANDEKSIWSCLLFCAIESKSFRRCNFFFARLKKCGTPSQKDYGNMVRYASINADWQLSLKLITEMREASLDIDSVIYNTALATCVSADHVDQARKLLEEMEQFDGVTDVITYNTIMKGCAKAGRMEQCFELFELMRARGISPSQVTYGILLDGCINENQLDSAQKVFKSMADEGCPMNTVLYTTLIKGFARAGQVDQAMKLFEQMRTERNVPPDLITFSILIKANCDADRLDTALKLLETMCELGLRPDEVAFNNLLSGCGRPGNVELGKKIYGDMIASGVRPSNATFSIMIRLYAQCKLLEEATDMLQWEPAKHQVEPEPRLYLQLITCCIRERQGRRTVEVYRMMAAVRTPTMAAHASILSTCVKLNMYETASDILGAAADSGSRVDVRDASALLDAVLRKQKMQIARECVASMERLGLEVEPRVAVRMGG